MKRYKGKYINFKNPSTGKYSERDPNCEGMVEKYDGKKGVVYVTNMNQPFMGTLIRASVSVEDIVV